MKHERGKPVMLNGVMIGRSFTVSGCEVEAQNFAGFLFGPLFNDGRNAGAVRMAAIEHLSKAFNLTVNEFLHATTRGVAEGPNAFYIELGRPNVTQPVEVTRSTTQTAAANG